LFACGSYSLPVIINLFHRFILILMSKCASFCSILALQLYNKKMKITLLIVGKTEDAYLKEGIDKYLKRLKHYTKIEVAEITELKNTKALTQEQQKAKEAELILKKITALDYVILLDEKGIEVSSSQFAAYIDKKAVGSVANLVFIVGGPYGFDQTVYQRANDKLSLSRMTFSHQMVRLFFVEQLYRAFTIIKGEPYHHS
jgi:23S rRNA (pseudouridine1915-N3)-methyltransferase